MEKGINIRYIKDLLEHIDISNTEQYLHVKKEQLINIVSPLEDVWKKGTIGNAFCPITEEECREIILPAMPFNFDIGFKGGFRLAQLKMRYFNWRQNKNVK